MFLLLLHSRAVHHREEFTANDLDASMFERITGIISVVDSAQYRMIFDKTDNFEKYRQIFEINESFQADNSLSKRCRVLADLGVVTLMSQCHLYSFLTDFCDEILRGLTKEPLPILKVRCLESEPTYETRLTSITAEVPYRSLAKFDFEHLERLVEAILAEAEDFLWSLILDKLRELQRFREKYKIRNSSECELAAGLSLGPIQLLSHPR
jgi:hypothetical protein